jgi:hypothetical protein
LLNKVGIYLQNRAQYPEAQPLLQRAIAIYLKAIGPHHPSTKAIQSNYAIFIEAKQQQSK